MVLDWSSVLLFWPPMLLDWDPVLLDWTFMLLDWYSMAVGIWCHILIAWDTCYHYMTSYIRMLLIRNCQFYCGLLPFDLRIDIKRFKFYYKLSSIQNDSVCGLYMLCGKQEHDNLLKKHNLSMSDSVGACVRSLWQIFSNNIQTFL